MGAFKYGLNPHEAGTYDVLPDLGLVPAGRPISLNAYLDIHTAAQAANGRRDILVYSKHALPLFSVDTAKPDWRNAFTRMIAINAGRDFGGFVFTGRLTEEIVTAIDAFRFHTLSAPAADPGAIKLIESETMQQRHRGIVLAIGDIAPATEIRSTSTSSGHALQFTTELPVEQTADGTIERIMRLSRTLCAGIFENGNLLYNNSGFVDPLELVAFTLRPFEGADNSGLALATDACFGVKNPLPILAAAGIRTLHLFGAKAEYPSLIALLEENGIAVTVHERRAFSYSV